MTNKTQSTMQIKQDQVKTNTVVVKRRRKKQNVNGSVNGDGTGWKSSKQRSKKRNYFIFPYFGSDVTPVAVLWPEVKSVSTYRKCNQTGSESLWSWTGSSKQEVKNKKDKHINGGSKVILEPLNHKELTSSSIQNSDRMMEAVYCLEPTLSKPMMLPPLQSPPGGAVGVDFKKPLRRRRSQSFDTAMLHTLPDGQRHLEALKGSVNKPHVNHRLCNGIATPRVVQKIKVIQRPKTRIGVGILQQLYNHIESDNNNSCLATNDRVEKHLNITVTKVTKDWTNDLNLNNEGQGKLQGHERIPHVNRCVTRSRSSRPDSRMSIATSSLVVPSTTVSPQVSF